VIELGVLPIADIVSYYGCCHILLVPSEDDCFPSVIREFSFFNKPIVACDVGAMGEFKELGLDIGICGTDAGEITTAIQSCIANYSLNSNRRLYFDYFDPDNEDVQGLYLSIFKRFL